MEKKPLVSIISPTYNHEKYIKQCIESVLSQTFTNWEMIIIDDCSTDNTESIIKKFNDPRIKYIRHSYNYGKERLAQLHNEALAISKGEFITILEGDDYWPPNHLKLQIDAFKTPDIVLCHGLGLIIKGENQTLSKDALHLPKDIIENNPVGSALKVFIGGRNFILAQTVMVKKDALLKIDGFKQSSSLYFVDHPTWMELSLIGKFAFIPEVFGYWRRHTGSISASYLYQENYKENQHFENWCLGIIEYSKIFVINHLEEIKKLPVNLDKYIENPGFLMYASLYKLRIFENRRKEAKEYLKKIWQIRSAFPLFEKFKILILTSALYIPFLVKVYRKYIKLRTSKISP